MISLCTYSLILCSMRMNHKLSVFNRLLTWPLHSTKTRLSREWKSIEWKSRDLQHNATQHTTTHLLYYSTVLSNLSTERILQKWSDKPSPNCCFQIWSEIWLVPSAGKYRQRTTWRIAFFLLVPSLPIFHQPLEPPWERPLLLCNKAPWNTSRSNTRRPLQDCFSKRIPGDQRGTILLCMCNAAIERRLWIRQEHWELLERCITRTRNQEILSEVSIWPLHHRVSLARNRTNCSYREKRLDTRLRRSTKPKYTCSHFLSRTVIALWLHVQFFQPLSGVEFYYSVN